MTNISSLTNRSAYCILSFATKGFSVSIDIAYLPRYVGFHCWAGGAIHCTSTVVNPNSYWDGVPQEKDLHDESKRQWVGYVPVQEVGEILIAHGQVYEMRRSHQ